MRALAAAACAVGPLSASARAETLESDVKAAYVDKLGPFVEWPNSAFDGPNAPFTICVIGRDAVAASLERLSAGQRLHNRPVVIRRLAQPDPQVRCQIAFVAMTRLRDGLRTLGRSPVLTVTDEGDPPGMVDFTIVDGRVRFRIDDVAAADAGLTISSKLLSLAVAVKQRERQP